ncbi:D-alanyl-lipoteichoic acid acyltransferase DltB (MBOAT superfamily) [Neobacillus niacini]|uniref:MBOAT family O-acyltransferase n=1 Tax=Neobacillus niacini TaxID=86668 RepID=UPI0028583FE7|nr:MBOAT family protein [Neobacillus niacini]MDR7079136.1 D-alanyl-lipoteichoic acid acyltransferase DltB (MBOAT superfamily) [Neobacillus niacini]
MLFNSYEFIFFFLPVVFIVYFFLNKKQFTTVAKIWLVASSLLFYSWWNIQYLPILLISLIFNYVVGYLLGKKQSKINRKALLIIGIVFNVSLLGYYKYFDFFISNINTVFDSNITLLKLVLPLGISFITFQKIAFLVDSYKRESMDYNFLNFSLFVTFFPQLIAGPIVHHKEIMPQFAELQNKNIKYQNISRGIFIFSIGLFKKVAIADTLAAWATKGFDQTETLTFFEGWITSLAYTLQLYFDFSGYTDMAIGAALLFNIVLPINFNSPYKALDIQDFWRRWHITLSRFLTQYIYIPLGGNRKGKTRTYINILLVFLISGFWHGAGWTFIFWGFLHGFATVVNRYWKSLGIKLNKYIAWFITFNFVNVAWVFFRATNWEDAIKVLKGMAGVNGVVLPDFGILSFLENSGVTLGTYFIDLSELVKMLPYLFICMIIVVYCKNSRIMSEHFRPNILTSVYISILFVYCILNFNKISEFLYFNF